MRPTEMYDRARRGGLRPPTDYISIVSAADTTIVHCPFRDGDCHASDIGHWLAMTWNNCPLSIVHLGRGIATPVCALARNDME